MRRIAGLVVAAGLVASAASAGDYVGARPDAVRGKWFNAGQKVRVGPGQPLVLMAASQTVEQLRGNALGWITLPTPPDPTRGSRAGGSIRWRRFTDAGWLG